MSSKNKDPKNLGYEVEKNFYDYIKKCSIFDFEIKSEVQLKKQYGWAFTSIDYLLITQDGIIPIQIKYRKTRRKEDHFINNFLKSVDELRTIYDKPILFGLWISRILPFLDNQSLLQTRKVECVSYFYDSKILIEKSIEYIMQKMLTQTQTQ